MDDLSLMALCADFLKAYFGNPHILILLIILALAAGVSMRLRRIEKSR